MVNWKSGTGSALSTKKLWLRKIRASFHLYRRLIFIFFFALLACILIALSHINPLFLRHARTIVITVATPVLEVLAAPFEWAESTKDYFVDWGEARERAMLLAQENKRLEKELALMQPMVKENQDLRALFNVRTHLKQTPLTTKVVSYPGRPYVKSILVNSGHKEGVHLQQVAIDGKGLVGRVVNVGAHVSRILLLTDLNSHVPVVLRGTRMQGILVGANEQTPFLKYMKAKSVFEGQVVETSGYGGVFPPGVPVGRISKVEEDSILVSLFSDVDHLSFLMLLEPVIEEELKKLVDHEKPSFS